MATASLVELKGPNEAIEVSPVEVMQELATSADVMQQIATARRFPRSIARFRKTALEHATLDEEVAKQCLFALPRAGKVIEGPSIRFAEILISAWGNCRVGGGVAAELERFVVGRGFFWDLETNSAVAMEAQRRITNKNGSRYDVDMIGVTGNAAASIAMRNAALRAIPKALWWGIYLKAKGVAVGDVKTLASRRTAALDAFKPFGVVEAQVFAALGVEGVMDITTDHLAILAGFHTAITTEERDPEELFPKVETKTKAAPPPVENKASPQDGSPAGKTEGADARGAKPASTAGGRSAPSTQSTAKADDKPSDLEMGIASMLGDAETLAQVESLRAYFAEEIDQAPPDIRAKAEKLFDDERAKFELRA